MIFLPGATLSRRVGKEFRQTKAIELYLKHYSQSQIADELEALGFPCDRSTISGYIAAARKEWRESRLNDMDEIFERELAELDEMEMEAVKLFIRFADHLDEDDIYLSSKEASEWIKARLKIKEQRQKLLGLNSPVKMQHSGDVKINLTVADCGIVEEVREED